MQVVISMGQRFRALVDDVVRNDDVLLEVFESVFPYLNWMDRLTLENVCHQWRDVAVSSWRDVEFVEVNDHPCYLSINNFSPVSLNNINEVSRYCSKILFRSFELEYFVSKCVFL